MKPAFSYFGGKATLAPWIASLLPPHRVYVEPFAGSAAVLFAKTPTTHEIINDAEGDVVNFLRMLRDRPEDLELACRLTPYARDEYSDADLDGELDEMERARRWWVRSSQSFGKMAKVGTGWSTSIERGSNNARSVWNRIDRFADTAKRLGTVTIENRDALKVIEAYDAVDGVIYCDPPYLGSTRSALAGGRRPGGDYFVEFHTEEQHRALADALHVARSTVLVSGYASELYDLELYTGWSRYERRVLRRAANGRGAATATGHATEVLWCSRPLDASLFADGGPERAEVGS